MKGEIRISIATAIIAAIIYSAASFSILSLSQSYAFAQTQGNAGLSLTNLIKQDQPHQGSISAPITIIDFSDLQCRLCQRFVKSTEPQINSTYVQTGKVALVFEHLPNRGLDSTPAALQPNVLTIRESFGNSIICCIKIKVLLTLDGLAKTI